MKYLSISKIQSLELRSKTIIHVGLKDAPSIIWFKKIKSIYKLLNRCIKAC